MINPEEAYSYEEMVEIANFLQTKTQHRPSVGIICGSGLSFLADLLAEKDIIKYEDVPRFPRSTVKGHSGQLVFGKLSGKVVVCMQGRIHPYEGHPMWKCAMPVRLMKLCGASILVVTNAAGGLNPSLKTGDIMLIKDHINFAGLAGNHPLRGLNDDRWGPRFSNMNCAYDPELLRLARDAALEVGAGSFLKEGVYCMLGGPSFETVAEVKMLRLLGADCVGMSTSHEVIVAKHCGLRVVGLSLITNEAVASYEANQFACHDEVLATARQRATVLEKIVSLLVFRMH
ncbi:purine nucleoside phosphorylase-like isoform X2 [Varroa jacobsoni]|nr:purine nucleoside phosphorylase-like isoform X2 [Varroa destructor]XP_022646556.1 purine nucleoside phosphorylase-like isoform X2 [Varroa destructor]XP_022646557.1 purine nucleoside phosphorylase-like isoform X2 [Varroa destructor]XP_022646559.1 purine nucleoside phosphorylase-like isoform X2 [Varroa destructor]XP_022692885.1 purine nucleoside phosphorylase-like isoform X2 [Varroa jacobsoni]XP_022692886.1 purine nucleoside phosphorylase-like isoform X2 [Varroa jacobsoni]